MGQYIFTLRKANTACFKSGKACRFIAPNQPLIHFGYMLAGSHHSLLTTSKSYRRLVNLRCYSHQKSVCHCWKALMRVEVAAMPLTISAICLCNKLFSCNCPTCFEKTYSQFRNGIGSSCVNWGSLFPTHKVSVKLWLLHCLGQQCMGQFWLSFGSSIM